MIRLSRKSGMILITVLWILAILSLLALSLSKRSSLDLSFVRNSIGRLKAYAAARAGVNYAQNLLQQARTTRDTLYECGIKFSETQDPENLFKDIKVDKDTHFDILFSRVPYGSKEEKSAFGLVDEQGKINLNSINANNYKVFGELVVQMGLSESDGNNLAAAVIDWHSPGTVPFKAPDSSVEGAKDEYYMGLKVPYKCKNLPFDHVEELLMVRGMTEELFLKIKDYVSVFPKVPNDPGIRVNFNTASDVVIRAVVAGLSVQGDGRDVVRQMIRMRDGKDHIPFTIDDKEVETGSLSTSEQLMVNQYRQNNGIEVSQFFRVQSLGIDEATHSRCLITAVLYRPQAQGDVSVVAWHKD